MKKLIGFVAILSLSLITGLGVTMGARAALPATEGGLNQAGSANEINPDAAGKLWVSDYSAHEIWGIDPVTGGYDIYHVGGNPADARQVDGFLWWADGIGDGIGRLSTSGDAYDLWHVPGAGGFYSTSLDAQGRFYAADLLYPHLFRINPSSVTQTLCDFTLPELSTPGSWLNGYMLISGGYLWLVDLEGQVLRLQLSNNLATIWTLTTLSIERQPNGVALDASGNLWYTDEHHPVLSRLDPTTNILTSFAMPLGSGSTTLAVRSGFIWFTDSADGYIGRLDPSQAGYTTDTIAYMVKILNPVCVPLVSQTYTLSPIAGSLAWAPAGYRSVPASAGWRIYAMPPGSAPWGIALGDEGYVVDASRRVLSRYPFEPFITCLPLIRR